MILLAIAAAIGLALLAFYYWRQVLGQESSLGTVPFSRWLWPGLVVPSAAWLFLNCGLVLPPLLPPIARVKSAGGNWLPLLMSLPAPGLLLIASFWGVVTFAQLAVVIACHAESRREFAVIAAFWAAVSSPFVWLISGGGPPWASAA